MQRAWGGGTVISTPAAALISWVEEEEEEEEEASLPSCSIILIKYLAQIFISSNGTFRLFFWKINWPISANAQCRLDHFSFLFLVGKVSQRREKRVIKLEI